MNGLKELWKKLGRSKTYREEFAESILKRSFPFQVRAIRKKRGWSQAELAQQANVTQGVISRAENPDYGNLTFSTVARIAAGFDMAFIGKFVPFSELTKFSKEMDEDEFSAIPTFEEENRLMEAVILATPPRSERSNVIDIKSAQKELNEGRKQPKGALLTGNQDKQLARGNN
jgi:transcriptional regulator with XRE-family HTH domain